MFAQRGASDTTNCSSWAKRASPGVRAKLYPAMELPSDDALRFLVSRYAHLLAEHGEAFEGVELVTPTGAHFPDAFAKDPDSVGLLLRRMMSYAPLDEDM